MSWCAASPFISSRRTAGDQAEPDAELRRAVGDEHTSGRFRPEGADVSARQRDRSIPGVLPEQSLFATFGRRGKDATLPASPRLALVFPG